jgi:hypothetical protein
MSYSRARRETLTPEEIAQVRAILEKQGEKAAREALGLASPATLHKVLAALPVHSLTASTVRGRLARALTP